LGDVVPRGIPRGRRCEEGAASIPSIDDRRPPERRQVDPGQYHARRRRVIAVDQPGTTRDSIYLDFERNDACTTLSDTAGCDGAGAGKTVAKKLLRWSRHSVQAIDDLATSWGGARRDAGPSDQDCALAGSFSRPDRALVWREPKWDAATKSRREKPRRRYGRKTYFMDFATVH